MKYKVHLLEEEHKCEICGSNEAMYTENPYNAEMHDDHEKGWYCQDCLSDLQSDI